MTITRSCLKLRCPSCKGRTRLDAESFAELRRRPNIGIDHTCEHCGHRFAATLLSGAMPASSPTPAPVPTSSGEMKPIDVPTAPATVPFAPKTVAAAGAPPFGLLGEGIPEAPKRARVEAAPVGSPPPFAAGAALNPPKEGKQSLGEWWKSHPPKRQWTFIACIGLTIGAAILSLDGKASAAGGKARKKAAAKAKENPDKPVAETPTSTKPIAATKTVEPEPPSLTALFTRQNNSAEAKKPQPDGPKTKQPESKKLATSDSPMALLFQEMAGIAGTVQTPLAAAWALDGKGFVARGAKVLVALQAAGDSTNRWVIQTPTKRYKVIGVKFHPEFPAAKLKELIAKGAETEKNELLKKAERVDLALLETEEAPSASMKLAREPAALSGKALVIASLVDPQVAKVGEATVNYATQPLKVEMFKDQGAGLALTMAPGVDSVVTTNDGLLVSIVPRREASAVHPIITTDAIAELLAAK